MLVFVYVLYVWLLKKYTADHWGRLIVTSLLVGPAELRKREDEFRVPFTFASSPLCMRLEQATL